MQQIVLVGITHFPECSQAGSEVGFSLYIFLYPAAQPALTNTRACNEQCKGNWNGEGGSFPPVKWEKRLNCLSLTCLCCWPECNWICLSLKSGDERSLDAHIWLIAAHIVRELSHYRGNSEIQQLWAKCKSSVCFILNVTTIKFSCCVY